MKNNIRTKFDISNDEVLKFIEPYVKEKKILDLGCVEHELKNIHKQRIWVHDYLISVGKEVIGVDFLQEPVRKLNKRGYKILCQNVENLKVSKKFDVIFAGELIEHLSSPGKFLESVKKYMDNDTIFIITTPNAFSFNRFIKIIYQRTNNPSCNPEHVSWYSPNTLFQLLSRYNLIIEKLDYAHYSSKIPSLKRFIVHAGCRLLGKRFKETMIAVVNLNNPS